MNYNYYVSASDGRDRNYAVKYNGGDAADAMAAWSKAITDGATYIVLEAIEEQ